MAQESRSEKLQIRVTPADRAAIERFSEARGMAVSEFGRAAMLAVMAARGEQHSLKMLKKGFSAVVNDWVTSLKSVMNRAA